jgi:hypothetical protein
MPANERRLLVNAKTIAAYALGDERWENAIYESLKTGELPLERQSLRLHGCT